MSTQRPLISIVIPTYNRSQLLMGAVESVCKQTYENWELIIADDGSSDNTVEAVKQLKDPRIRLLTLTHTGLSGKVRNAGARQSKGEWIAFLDSDDLWKPNRLSIQLELLEKEKTRWIYGKPELIDNDGKEILKRSGEFHPFSGWITDKILNTETDFHVSSLLVERKFFEECGGFSEEPMLMFRDDHEFVLRMSMQEKASVVPETIISIREHAGRSTKQLPGSCELSANVYTVFLRGQVNKRFKKIAFRWRAFHMAEASTRSFRLGHYRAGLKQLGQSLRDAPGKKYWLSALKTGVYAVFKKNSRPSSGKGKKNAVTTYNT